MRYRSAGIQTQTTGAKNENKCKSLRKAKIKTGDPVEHIDEETKHE